MFDQILESYQIWETEALSELMRLQKARVITIQRCDKGIIILNTQDFIRPGENHPPPANPTCPGRKASVENAVSNQGVRKFTFNGNI